MTDQELLTLAAEAAGISYIRGISDATLGLCVSTGDDEDQEWWNPLVCDADAMRLAVHLRISLEQDASIEIDSFTHRGVTTGEYALGVEAWFVTRTGIVIKAQEGYSDDAAATRRAIVRVAAQLAEK